MKQLDRRHAPCQPSSPGAHWRTPHAGIGCVVGRDESEDRRSCRLSSTTCRMAHAEAIAAFAEYTQRVSAATGEDRIGEREETAADIPVTRQTTARATPVTVVSPEISRRSHAPAYP